MKIIGLIEPEGLDENTQKFIAAKRAEFESKSTQPEAESASSDYPANATMCKKCNTKAVIIMDGCGTCLSCGDSKCS